MKNMNNMKELYIKKEILMCSKAPVNETNIGFIKKKKSELL